MWNGLCGATNIHFERKGMGICGSESRYRFESECAVLAEIETLLDSEDYQTTATSYRANTASLDMIGRPSLLLWAIKSLSNGSRWWGGRS